MSASLALKVAVRRSVALGSLAGFLVLAVVHLWLRERAWTREWYWTVDSYAFATIFVAPLAAGVAAWDGARWSPTTEPMVATGRLRSAIAAAWVPAAVYAVVAHLAGLVAALVITKVNGTPGLPGPRELLSILPSIALLVFAAMAGSVFGWVTRRPLAAPLAAIAMFVLLLFGYTSFPETWLRIGGATGSLLALRPRTSVHLLQVGLYLAAGCALVEALRLKLERQRIDWRRSVAIAGPAVAFCLVLTWLGGMRFYDQDVATECVGDDLEICTAPEYRFMQRSLEDTVGTPLDRLREAGFEPPQRITQNLSEQGDAGTIVIGTTLPDFDSVASILTFSIIPSSCDIFRDQSTYQAYLDVDYWVRSLLGGAGDDSSVTPVVAEGDTPAARDFVRGIHEELVATCVL